jgi:hypothetical protein
LCKDDSPGDALADAGEIRAAGLVSVLGRIVGDPKVLRAVRSGAGITVEKVIPALPPSAPESGWK